MHQTLGSHSTSTSPPKPQVQTGPQVSKVHFKDTSVHPQTLKFCDIISNKYPIVRDRYPDNVIRQLGNALFKVANPLSHLMRLFVENSGLFYDLKDFIQVLLPNFINFPIVINISKPSPIFNCNTPENSLHALELYPFLTDNIEDNFQKQTYRPASYSIRSFISLSVPISCQKHSNGIGKEGSYSPLLYPFGQPQCSGSTDLPPGLINIDYACRNDQYECANNAQSTETLDELEDTMADLDYSIRQNLFVLKHFSFLVNDGDKRNIKPCTSRLIFDELNRIFARPIGTLIYEPLTKTHNSSPVLVETIRKRLRDRAVALQVKKLDAQTGLSAELEKLLPIEKIRFQPPTSEPFIPTTIGPTIPIHMDTLQALFLLLSKTHLDQKRKIEKFISGAKSIFLHPKETTFSFQVHLSEIYAVLLHTNLQLHNFYKQMDSYSVKADPNCKGGVTIAVFCGLTEMSRHGLIKLVNEASAVTAEKKLPKIAQAIKSYFPTFQYRAILSFLQWVQKLLKLILGQVEDFTKDMHHVSITKGADGVPLATFYTEKFNLVFHEL